MKYKFILNIVPIVVIVLASCKQADKSTNMVPADAGFVLHVNASSLSSKLEWKEIQQTSWFAEIYAEASDSIARDLLNDPENSGIDTKSDFIFFVKSMGQNTLLAFEGGVKNAETFETFNSKVNKSSAVPKIDGSFSSLPVKDNGIVVWNDKNFIYIFNMQTPSPGNIPGMNNGSRDVMPESRLSGDSLRTIAQSLFALEQDESLGGNEKFNSLLKETGDMHIWMNAENLYSNMGAGMLSMMRLNVIFEGNISATALNFDNGKITMKSRQYYGKEMTDLLEDYQPKEVSADVINRIPNKDVVAAFVMNYSPEGLKAFIKLIGVDGVVNGFLGNANYSIDEFVKANKGDIVVAVSDLKIQTKTATNQSQDGSQEIQENKTPDVKFLFSTSVKDRAAFDKLITTFKAQVPQAQQDAVDSKFTYKLDNNWFAMSNSPEYVDQFLAGTANKPDFASRISGHPFGGFVDIQKILQSTKFGVSDSSSENGLKASMSIWENIVFHGGEIRNGAMLAEVEINLIDKKTNSLKQLNSFFDILARNKKSKTSAAIEDTTAIDFE